MSIIIIVVAIVSAIIGALGLNQFKKNEIKVIELQEEKRKFIDNEQDVPDELEKSLNKAHIVSLNYKKLQLVGFTIAPTVIIAGLIKLML